MLRILRILISLSFSLIGTNTLPFNNVFELSIVHINDFHASFEAINTDTLKSCETKNKNCVGGFSRIYTTINQLVKERPNSIVLNAGDNFQGSSWYNLYRWNVTQHFLNLLPFDAYTLGNHEFDHGMEGLVPFIRSLKVPTVVANIDDGEEQSIQGLYKKYLVVERSGKRIGIIGVIKKNTHELSNTGRLKFLDESTTVNEEAENLINKEHVDIIIVVSHCGYEIDKAIARNATSKISVIVGAHSHTFLYSGNSLPGPDVPEGPYQTIVARKYGKSVLIVQAAAHSKYVGNLTVFYDSEENVISWSGDPIYLNYKMSQDDEINTQLQIWKQGLNDLETNVIGESSVALTHNNCNYAECTLGNFVTDAMIYEYLDKETVNSREIVALINSGGLKTTIEPGNITLSNILLALPYGNTIDLGQIKGKYLKEALEYALVKDNNLLQVSGLRVLYNLTKAVGSQLESIKVRCGKFTNPQYEDLELEKQYIIVVNSFLANSGNGYKMISSNLKNRKIGKPDVDVVEHYIKKKSPITQTLENRIIFYFS